MLTECGNLPEYANGEPLETQVWVGNAHLDEGETELSCAKRCKMAHPGSTYFQKYKDIDQCECLKMPALPPERRLTLWKNENFTVGHTQSCGMFFKYFTIIGT